MARTSNTIMILTGIAAVVSVAAGIYVMMNPWNPTTTQQVVVGLASIIGGILFAGYAVMDGKVWGRTVGVLLALGGAVVNLAFIPYYPIWSILLVMINVVVIYALTVHGRDIVSE